MSNTQREPLSPGTKRLIIASVVFGLLLLSFAGYHWTLRGMVADRLSAIRAAGQPATMDDLPKYYTPLPADQDAGPLYRKALEAYVVHDTASDQYMPLFGIAREPALGQPWPKKMLDAARNHVQANEASLRLLHEAAAIGQARFFEPWIGDFDALTQPMRFGRRGWLLYLLLNARAVAEAEGRTHDAAEAIVSAWIMTLADDCEPGWGEHLWDVSMRASVLARLHASLNLVRYTDDDLVRLITALRRMDEGAAIQQGLVSQVPFMNQEFDGSLPPEQRAVDLTGWRKAAYLISGGKQLDQLAAMDVYARAAKAALLPPHQRQAEVVRLAEEAEGKPWLYQVTRDAGRWPRNYIRTVMWTESRTADAVAALAVERYRLAEGKLPDRLADVEGRFIEKLPLDPHTGKPLFFKRVGDGYIVYGTGDDSIDNGGADRNADGRSLQPGSDITFEVGIPHPPLTEQEMMPPPEELWGPPRI